MVVAVTYIQLRSAWQFFKLSLHGLRISRQLRAQKGFVRMKNTGFGRHHFTMSLWESEADIGSFVSSGAHRLAMQDTKALSTDLRTHVYVGDELPAWSEAKRIVLAHDPRS